MKNALRNIALQMTIPVLCGLIALNAYLVLKNLKRIQNAAAHRVEASEVQADISNLLFDLQDMETGQRGYLVTGDSSYLQPYNDANGRLGNHFAKLRSRLAGKTPQERSLETQLESLADSMMAEMKETIRLRQAGYRHRAFLIVNSNRGKEFMDEARTTLHALSSAQATDVATYSREMRERVTSMVRELALASCILLVVTVTAFLAFSNYRKRLEIRYAQQTEELRATRLQVERFTSTVFHDFRALVLQMRSYADTLIDIYGGYLPRQGEEKAECIQDGAGQMNRLLDDLSKDLPSENSDSGVEVRVLERLSA
jgi:CHASE3 domain sensor protein